MIFKFRKLATFQEQIFLFNYEYIMKCSVAIRLRVIRIIRLFFIFEIGVTGKIDNIS